MIKNPATIAAGAALMARKAFLLEHQPLCWGCKSKRVEMRDWIFPLARWRCRVCRLKFHFEPIRCQ